MMDPSSRSQEAESKREQQLRREAGRDPGSSDHGGEGTPQGQNPGGHTDGDDSSTDGGARLLGAARSQPRAEQQVLSTEDMRRAAKEGLKDLEEERSGDGLYGSSSGGPVLGPAVAELVGTFILVFGGTAVAVGAILSSPTAGEAYDSLAVALAFGLTLVAVVAAVGHVSGAHVNPAVTLAMAATGKFSWKLVPVYVVAQLVGAVLAALATWLTFGPPARSEANLAATYPAQGVGDLQAFFVEVLITFVLVFVVMAVATDSRAPAAIAPVAVGFALAVGVFIAGPVTGGAVNPARALGPMLVAGDLTSAWLYILGPLVGGVLAAFLYDRLLTQPESPDE